MFLQVLVWTSVWSLIISKGITGLGVQWFLLGFLLSEKLTFFFICYSLYTTRISTVGVELSLNINYGE